MRVYLVRHAASVPEDRELPDHCRYLSPEGRAAARATGAALAALGIAIDWIYASPLVRAVQTAELIAAATGGGPVVAMFDLEPRGNIELAARALAASGRASIAAVGHEPALSALGSVLVGSDSVAMLDKVEVVLIEDGRVRWRLPSGAKTPQPFED